MHSVLLVLHILVAIALVGLVLVQHGKGADAGAAFGSGASATVFGARGSSSFLTRASAILAAVFFITSLSLAYFSVQEPDRASVTEIHKPEAAAKESMGISPLPNEGGKDFEHPEEPDRTGVTQSEKPEVGADGSMVTSPLPNEEMKDPEYPEGQAHIQQGSSNKAPAATANKPALPPESVPAEQ